MTTQLINSLTVDERIKPQAGLAESAAEVLAPRHIKTDAESATEALPPSNSPQLVSSLTVDELMEVIANVVDARLNSFFSSLDINGEKKSSESETLGSTEVEKENPWLKMAGLHKNNPLFEEVVAYIETNRENDFAEELR